MIKSISDLGTEMLNIKQTIEEQTITPKENNSKYIHNQESG